MLKLCLLVVVAAAIVADARASRADDPRKVPIQLHPDNPRYFLFRGKPLVLISACEHYGSVINRPFDFEMYLDDAAEHGMTMTRTFLLYRELQTPRNPWSPCKPESPDFVTPYPRTGPGKAKDNEPKFDLDRWNPEFFERLNRFLTSAAKRGIVVELTIFSHTYNDEVWSLNPLNAINNVQGVGAIKWAEYDTLRNSDVVARQEALARKIVQETCRFDNVYYEVCNEPAGGKAGSGVTVDEVDPWLDKMNAVVRDELKRQGRPHLVFGTQAFDVAKLRQDFEASFAKLDAVVVHPHPDLYWAGRRYNLGNFMSKELALAALRDFCLAVQPQPKPVVHDEDNIASCYRDPNGWTIHRKRAWTSIMCGTHYDYIDFSITVGREAGTPESRAGLREPFRHLSKFIHSFDFIHAKPNADWIRGLPKEVVVSTLAVEGSDYAAYLADGREFTETGAGEPIRTEANLTLPAGRYRVRLYSPTSGLESPAWTMDGGKAVTIELPPFRHDVVLRANSERREGSNE